MGEVKDEVVGLLPDGTSYGIKIPGEWNGVLVNDLDFHEVPEKRSAILLSQGYALSGTRRHSRRRVTYDPYREMTNQARVLELFHERYIRPQTTIQYGDSGGGAVALGMSEAFPDLIDGVVAACAQTGLVIANMQLDLLYSMAMLLSLDLPFVGVPVAEGEAISQAWRVAVHEAWNHPVGRARIALALAVSQYPSWVVGSKPEPGDLRAATSAVYDAACEAVPRASFLRTQTELGSGGIPSWNTDVEYAEYLRHADPAIRTIVDVLYQAAGGPGAMHADLQRLDEAPRVKGDDGAVHYWTRWPRLHRAAPEVPVLRIHTTGDGVLPPILTSGYSEGVELNSAEDLYRCFHVDRAGHCTYTPEEVDAAIEALRRRIEVGTWDVSPAALNSRVSEMRATGRFVAPPVAHHNRSYLAPTGGPTDFLIR